MLTTAIAQAQSAPLRRTAAEATFHGGHLGDKSGALSGKTLQYWGDHKGDYAEFTFTLPQAQTSMLGVRYAYDREQYLRRYPNSGAPHILRILLDGREITARQECPDTGGWNIFSTLRVPLGEVAAGAHTLRLESVADKNDIDLDLIEIGGADYRPDTRAAVTLPTRSRHFRIRLSPRVNPETFPARQVFANLEAQYAFHRDFLGMEPGRVVLLTVVAQADWWDNGLSAVTQFGNIYLQEREITTPGNNYAHEMFHNFEQGMEYPTWWSEGVAFLVSMRSDEEVYGVAPAEVAARIKTLRTWWEKEGRAKMVREGINPVVWWGSDRVPQGISGNDLYRAANLLLYTLWEREGDAFFLRLYRRLQADRTAGRYRIPDAAYTEKHRLLLEYLQQAAPKSLNDFWKEWALPSQLPEK